MIGDEKRPGRPSLQPGAKSVPVRITFPPDLYDKLCRDSNASGIPMARLHRRAVRRYYGEEDDDD